MSDVNVEETVQTAEEKAKQLPIPSGYRVLCMVPQVEDKFGGTELLKPDSLIKVEEHSTIVLFVVELGPDAYRDASRFPNGAWCKKGDFILTRAYAGTRLKIHGREFRIINDDSVEAVVDDPRGITRAG